MNPETMSAVALSKAIKEKQISVPEVVSCFIDAIEKNDPQTNAFITVCADRAMQKAAQVQKEIDKGSALSALAGIPIAVKDNICTKGVLTSCASGMLSDYVPVYNATAVQKLEDSGMIIIGKTNMDEFAMGSTTETSHFGPTKNPKNPEHVPGGSSGGSAAAVAGKMVLTALGSDTGGSIRQPASYCGITGFKPTYGMVSRYGLVAYASSLDQIGPMAKNTQDCAALMDIIKGRDPYDGTSADSSNLSFLNSLSKDLKGVRIGIPAECYENAALDGEVAKHTLAVSEVLQQCGAQIKSISMPFLSYVVPSYYILATAEASSNLSRYDGVKYGFRSKNYTDLSDLYTMTRNEGFGFEVKKRILLGTFVLSSGYYDAYYLKALKVKAMIKQQFESLFNEVDLILCPTSPNVAPKQGESLKDPMKMYLADIFTVSANLAGLPCISFPCGATRDGLPIGAQLLGNSFRDLQVLNAAYAFQSLTEYHMA